MYVCMYVRTYVCMYIRMYICMVCVCMYVCMYDGLCMYVCTYVRTYFVLNRLFYQWEYGHIDKTIKVHVSTRVSLVYTRRLLESC